MISFTVYSFLYFYHLIIGFRKKLEALAKQKDCDLVGKWLRSIINHLYWSVASTPDGDAEKMKVKWLSLDNHVHDVHSGHHGLFPNCLHGPQEQKKKWFTRRKYECCTM